MRRPDPRVARQIEIGLFVPRVTHRPVPDPRWSLTVSRKAKKGVPGSSRREGPPSPQATRFGALGVGIRVASVTSWWLQGGLVAQAEAASFQEDDSGILPASLAPGDGRSRRVFRARPSAQGAARDGGEEGGPMAPKRAAWPAGWWRWGPAVPSPLPCRQRSRGCR